MITHVKQAGQLVEVYRNERIIATYHGTFISFSPTHVSLAANGKEYVYDEAGFQQSESPALSLTPSREQPSQAMSGKVKPQRR